MKQKAKIYKGKRIVIGDKNLVTKNEIHVNDIPQEGGESGGGNTSSRPKYTGHADVEGLKAIGWTDEDIAYYQENGVNWNEEDDQYHKVADDNKALYGVLTASNISTYKDRIVYLPKIDTSNVTSMSRFFESCTALVSIPQLNTSNVTSMDYMFRTCRSLVTIPLLDTGNVKNMSYMFQECTALLSVGSLDTQNVTTMNRMFINCYSLKSIPQLNTSKVTDMSNMFYNCHSLVTIPPIDTQNVISMSSMFEECNSLISIPQLNTSNVTSINSMFKNCISLVLIPLLDTDKVTNNSGMVLGCYSLAFVNIKNNKLAISFSYSSRLNKESLLYLINNEASTTSFTITLKAYTYDRWSTDADVVAALEAHPNVSLTKS